MPTKAAVKQIRMTPPTAILKSILYGEILDA
jgi:hypothetical protein